MKLTLSYSKSDVLGFDKAGLSYGRHKVAMGHESHTSSKKIKTVERSHCPTTSMTTAGLVLKCSGEKGRRNRLLQPQY